MDWSQGNSLCIIVSYLLLFSILVYVQVLGSKTRISSVEAYDIQNIEISSTWKLYGTWMRSIDLMDWSQGNSLCIIVSYLLLFSILVYVYKYKYLAPKPSQN